MEAFKRNIYKYLDGTCQYLIPLYQRTYSWEKEQCARLWDDIVNLHKTSRKGHFVGSIVRINEAAAAGFTKAMIIDGQQRLTTLTLLLVALRDYAVQHPSCGVNPDKITNTLLLNQYESGDAKYKLLLTQSDRDILTKKIECAPIVSALKSRILDSYIFFAGQIATEEIAPADLYDSIGKLQIVDIELDRQYDDPQAIFESLNSTGMDLKDSDLIRNHLLMGLDSSIQEEIYNNIWRPTELLFDDIRQSELLDNFFRDYLTMKLGRIPRKNEVYKEFCSFRSNCDLELPELCNDIYAFAEYYTNMCFCKSTDPALKSLYEDIKTIRMDVAYPFLLKIHGDYKKGLITIEDLREIIRFCISYVLRRAVCDLPTNSLNKTFRMMTVTRDICQDDYLRSVKAFFVLLDTYKAFPTDEHFLAKFRTRDIYNMGLNRCRYILGRLESWDNKLSVSLNDLTTEHIIPQTENLSADWKNSLGSNWNEIWLRCLHTIGNLTLTKYNSQMSDSSFLNKVNMHGGFKEHPLRLNKYIVSQTSWGEEQVSERAAQLGEIARKVWPYPVLSETELAPYCKKDDSSPQYSIESYAYTNADTKILFEALQTKIFNLGTSIRQEFRAAYIAYKVDTNFVDVYIRANAKLDLVTNLKYPAVIDPKGICTDISGSRLNGDVKVSLDSLDKLDDVMAIIEQAFRLQDME